MTIEKSAPRINQVNFYYDADDGSLRGISAHVTYSLTEDGEHLIDHNESVNIDDPALVAELTELTVSIASHVATKDLARSEVRQAAQAEAAAAAATPEATASA